MKTLSWSLFALCCLLLSSSVACIADVGDLNESNTGGELDEQRDDVVDDGQAGDAAEAEVDLGSIAQSGQHAKVVNTKGMRLRLRAGPSSGYGTIKFMNPDDIVEVQGVASGNYVPVEHQGQAGWAHGYYLQLVTEDDPQPTPTAGGTDYLLPWGYGLSYRVSQGHGVDSHSGKGLWAWDFAMPSGTPVLAAHDGVVRMVRGDSAVGGCSNTYANLANYVVLDRGDGLESLYLHLSSTDVQVGQIVNRGQQLGLSGATGWACGAHLHYQVQLSPDAGGGASWYNDSRHQYFHDTGVAYDPPAGSYPVSAN